MAEATFNFPKGFLWGTATSAHQVEGNNTQSNWHVWEQEEGRIFEGHTSGLACDWWGGRWREDMDRAAEGSQNAHRLSIEWSRVQPTPDKWDENVLDHYRQILRGMVERGLQPILTLHHNTDPLWLAEMGGWENENIVIYFKDYTEKVASAVGGFVKTWITLNEPNMYTYYGYVVGKFPPGKRDLNLAYRVMANQIAAHAAAYHKIHEIQPEAQVGMTHNLREISPRKKWFPPDRIAARLINNLFNSFYLNALHTGEMKFINSRIKIPDAKNTQDFLGVNYYSNDQVYFDLFAKDHYYICRELNELADLSPNREIANQPEQFVKVVRFAQKFGLPIIITENGTEDPQDEFRRRYMVEHIHKLWWMVNLGVRVKGYFHRSLVDNFEWDRGWELKFGLWELEKETQVRVKRPSADLYSAICSQNSLSSEMVSEYSPELYEKLFPG